MKKSFELVFLAIVFLIVLASGCAPGSTPVSSTSAAIMPTSTPVPPILTTSSAEWKLEITGADWGDSRMIVLEPGQKQLLLFTNLEYIGPDKDLIVPAFGVKNEQGTDFITVSSFGYGANVPFGGEDWISSFVKGEPSTRHFKTGEAFQPLMFTFAGPEATKTFIFFFGDLLIDFTSIVKSK